MVDGSPAQGTLLAYETLEADGLLLAGLTDLMLWEINQGEESEVYPTLASQLATVYGPEWLPSVAQCGSEQRGGGVQVQRASAWLTELGLPTHDALAARLNQPGRVDRFDDVRITIDRPTIRARFSDRLASQISGFCRLHSFLMSGVPWLYYSNADFVLRPEQLTVTGDMVFPRGRTQGPCGALVTLDDASSDIVGWDLAYPDEDDATEWMNFTCLNLLAFWTFPPIGTLEGFSEYLLNSQLETGIRLTADACLDRVEVVDMPWVGLQVMERNTRDQQPLSPEDPGPAWCTGGDCDALERELARQCPTDNAASIAPLGQPVAIDPAVPGPFTRYVTQTKIVPGASGIATYVDGFLLFKTANELRVPTFDIATSRASTVTSLGRLVPGSDALGRYRDYLLDQAHGSMAPNANDPRLTLRPACEATVTLTADTPTEKPRRGFKNPRVGSIDDVCVVDLPTLRGLLEHETTPDGDGLWAVVGRGEAQKTTMADLSFIGEDEQIVLAPWGVNGDVTVAHISYGEAILGSQESALGADLACAGRSSHVVYTADVLPEADPAAPWNLYMSDPEGPQPYLHNGALVVEASYGRSVEYFRTESLDSAPDSYFVAATVQSLSPVDTGNGAVVPVDGAVVVVDPDPVLVPIQRSAFDLMGIMGDKLMQVIVYTDGRVMLGDNLWGGVLTTVDPAVPHEYAITASREGAVSLAVDGAPVASVSWWDLPDTGASPTDVRVYFRSYNARTRWQDLRYELCEPPGSGMVFTKLPRQGQIAPGTLCAGQQPIIERESQFDEWDSPFEKVPYTDEPAIFVDEVRVDGRALDLCDADAGCPSFLNEVDRYDGFAPGLDGERGVAIGGASAGDDLTLRTRRFDRLAFALESDFDLPTVPVADLLQNGRLESPPDLRSHAVRNTLDGSAVSISYTQPSAYLFGAERLPSRPAAWSYAGPDAIDDSPYQVMTNSAVAEDEAELARLDPSESAPSGCWDESRSVRLDVVGVLDDDMGGSWCVTDGTRFAGVRHATSAAPAATTFSAFATRIAQARSEGLCAAP